MAFKSYCVVCNGHISFFDDYYEALDLAREFDGRIYNMHGLVCTS